MHPPRALKAHEKRAQHGGTEEAEQPQGAIVCKKVHIETKILRLLRSSVLDDFSEGRHAEAICETNAGLGGRPGCSRIINGTFA